MHDRTQDRNQRRYSEASPATLRTGQRQKTSHYDEDEDPQRDFVGDDEEHIGYPMRNAERHDWDARYTHAYDDYDSIREATNRSAYDEERANWNSERRNSFENWDSYAYEQNPRPHASDASRPNFSGRGPKSFTRSDERIKEDICEMLTRHSAIDAHDIDVEVKAGEVTLSGSVPERRMKHLAEDLTEHIFSVKDVINNIRVKKISAADRRNLPPPDMKRASDSPPTATSNSSH